MQKKILKIGFINFKRFLMVSLCLLSLITCKNSSSNKFDEFIENKYNLCNGSETCIVDLSSLPFKWDKLYIFSENHFPEMLTKEGISSILETKYNKSIELHDRLMVFLFKGKVVHEILSSYKKENLIDSKPLLVDFYLDRKIPIFFDSNNAKFIIRKNGGNYVLYWITKE